MPISVIYLYYGEKIIILGRHISDNHKIHWEIYYAHPQYGHRLFVDMLCQAAVGLPAAAAVCSGQNLQTNTHRQSCLAVLANRRTAYQCSCLQWNQACIREHKNTGSIPWHCHTLHSHRGYWTCHIRLCLHTAPHTHVQCSYMLYLITYKQPVAYPAFCATG